MHVLRVCVRVCIWWKAGNARRTGEPSVALSLSVLSEAAALSFSFASWKCFSICIFQGKFTLSVQLSIASEGKVHQPLYFLFIAVSYHEIALLS